MTDTIISRRTAILGAGAVTSAAALAAGAPGAAAKAPFAASQVAYWYRFPVGKFQATVVSDGPLPLGKPADTMKAVAESELTKSLADNFLPTDNVVLEQNALVLNTGTRLVLFDSGMGTSRMFGPTSGRLLRSLREAGINPAQIDDVVCTHAHIDHVGGLASATGVRYFPNATIHIAKSDYDFWTAEAKVADKDLGAFVKHARQNLMPYRNRLKFVEDGKDVLPGVQAMSAPGHTVGHTIFVIKSENKTLVFTGDTTHHQVLLTERPRTEFAYDTDPKLAVQSRLKVLDMIAKDRLPMLAFHFPWPGVGHLARQGDGYRYYAQPMEIVRILPKKA
jgi:glyoxylase-like metal-dependent hydrolase (beta-lactamase superfamily II)